MLNSIANAEHQKDSLLEDILAKLGNETDTKGTVTPIDDIYKIPNAKLLGVSYGGYFDKLGPYMPVEWGQEKPYNDSVGGQCGNLTNNGKYWAGCVATAVAQIMAHWRYPASPNLDWEELRKYTTDPTKRYPNDKDKKDIENAPPEVKKQLAKLFKDIGTGVGMNYGCEVSTANTTRALNFLSSLGFNTLPLMSYDSRLAMNFITATVPLIARGCSYKINHTVLGITYNTTYDGCHMWIMDGHVKRTAIYTIAINGVTYQIDSYFEYVHNNWGWNGGHNGYFANGVFDSQDNLSSIFEDSNLKTKSGQPYNFQYDLQMAVIYR